MALVQSMLSKQNENSNEMDKKPYIIEEPVWEDSSYGKILEEEYHEEEEESTKVKTATKSRKRQKIAECNDTVKNILSKQRTMKVKITSKDKKDSVYGLCIWCDQLISTRSLPEHTRQVHNAVTVHQKFVCPLCKVEIKVFSVLIQHISDLPSCCPNPISDNPPIKCLLCCETIVKVDTLKEHFSMFHNVKLDKKQQPYPIKRAYPLSSFWSCMYCGISEHSKTALTSHIKVYHYTRANHYCRFCGHVYHMMAALHKHLVIQHKNALSETLIDYYNLVADKTSETSGIIDFIKEETMCYYCDLEFREFSRFDEHFKETHRNPTSLKLLCCFCPESYNSRENLWIHVKTSHVLVNLDFIEPMLKRSFLIEMLKNYQELLQSDALPELVNSKVMINNGEDVCNAVCPLCNAVMKDDRHVNKKHDFLDVIDFFKEKIVGNNDEDKIKCISDKESWFCVLDQCADSKGGKVKCLMCTEVVFDKPNFYRHLVEYHFCTDSDLRCTKCFLSIKPEEKHSHDDVCKKRESLLKLLKCKECNFDAVDSVDLEDHMKAHVVKVHREAVKCGRLQCEMCSETFARKRDLQRHIMMKHTFGSEMCGTNNSPQNIEGVQRNTGIEGDSEDAKVAYRSTMPLNNFESNDSELFTSTDFIDISIVGSLDND